MEPNSLTNFYDALKSRLARPPMDDSQSSTTTLTISPAAFRSKCIHNADELRNDCRKHLILDIYCKILPADDDWKSKHFGLLRGDIDNMLANKNMTATQYMTAAYESTNAPLLDLMLWSTENIGTEYMKEAEEEIKQAEDNGETSVPEPENPDVNSDDVSSQLVDVSKDMDYKSFVDTLKQKTIDKIVNDISAIIDEEKDKNDMTFDTSDTNGMPNVPDATATESAVLTCMDWANKVLMKEQATLSSEQKEELLGMAIREATLRELDNAFNLSKSFNEFKSMITFGKGVIINESAINGFIMNKNVK